MFLKALFALSILFGLLNAKECKPYYNPSKFFETPEVLSEIIDSHLNQKGVSL